MKNTFDATVECADSRCLNQWTYDADQLTCTVETTTELKTTTKLETETRMTTFGNFEDPTRLEETNTTELTNEYSKLQTLYKTHPSTEIKDYRIYSLITQHSCA